MPISSFYYAQIGAAAPAVPALVQMVSSSTNLLGIQGQAVGYAKFTLPNPTKAGNCLILKMSYQTGITAPTITDDAGNSWPSTPTVTVDGGGTIAEIRVLPNTAAGALTFHAAFPTSAIPFKYEIEEWCNVATVSPVNGTTSASNVLGASLAAGSFTPTVNNDANGGNLISAYFALNATSASSHPTTWTPGGSFTLLSADNSWTTNQGFPNASQYWVQATQAAINPSITATGDTTDHFNCVAVALKAANAGTPKPAPGSGIIHIDKIIHISTTSVPSGTWNVQLPATGNLRVIAITFAPEWTSIADNDTGSSWVLRGGVSTGSSFWESAGRAAKSDLAITITTGSDAANNRSFRVYDISNAATVPFDLIASKTSASTSNLTTINDWPDITPTTSNGLVLQTAGLGLGPCSGFASGVPANAVFDLCWYGARFTATISGTVMTVSAIDDGRISVGDLVTMPGVTVGTTIASLGTGNGFTTGTYNLSASFTVSSPTIGYCGETDSSSMENADITAHYYNPDLSAIAWNFKIAPQASNSSDGVSIAYKHA